MTDSEAVPILSRWIAELQTDLNWAHQRIADLEERVRVADDIRWWLDRHTPTEIHDLAAALEVAA